MSFTKGILLSLLMIGVFPFLVNSAYASSYCDSIGNCKTASISYYGGHYLPGEYPSCVNLDVNSCGFGANTGCVDSSTGTYRESYDAVIKFYDWDGSSWVLTYSQRYYYSVETIQLVIDIFQLNGSPGVAVSGPAQDPNGTCSPPPPPCQDSEKICECTGATDQSGELVWATYVDFGKDCSSTHAEYISPSYSSDNNYTYFVNLEPVCFCPSEASEHNFPADFQDNFQIVEGDPSPSVPSEFSCAQSCYPSGYYYGPDGECLCVNDNSSTGTASPSPGASSDSSPSPDPTDPSDDSGWLQGIKSDLDSQIGQLNQSNQYLANIADNLSTSVNNQGVISDAIGNNTAHIDNLARKLSDIQDAIEEGNNQGYELQGSGSLPDDNAYDPEVNEVEENSLSDAVAEYIASGLPIISYIRGTSLQLNNASSSMQCELWGHTITFDLSSQESILNTMGYILTGLSMVIAFFIIVRR